MMFRCDFYFSDTPDRVVSGIYIETVVKNDNLVAIIVYEKKVVAIPLYAVTWTGWTD